jgi:hypothetical protein
MNYRDRVIELRRVPAGEIRRNAKNWRLHPPAQQAALRAVMSEVGFAGALLARMNDAGELELIDGHLRAELSPDALVPVLVLDVNATEAEQLLATHDAITAMATIDQRKFDALRAELAAQEPALRELLASVGNAKPKGLSPTKQRERGKSSVPSIPESYELVVTCHDENDQRQLYERLALERYACRVLTM